MKSAYEDLMTELHEGETIEAIVFGPWGWGSTPRKGEEWLGEYGEPEPPCVPFDKRGVLLTLDEAKPMMEGWQMSGGFGAPDCYAIYVWTNKRVMWITQYDGATGLDSAPRNPTEVMPEMPGG